MRRPTNELILLLLLLLLLFSSGCAGWVRVNKKFVPRESGCPKGKCFGENTKRERALGAHRNCAELKIIKHDQADQGGPRQWAHFLLSKLICFKGTSTRLACCYCCGHCLRYKIKGPPPSDGSLSLIRRGRRSRLSSSVSCLHYKQGAACICRLGGPSAYRLALFAP